jgi:hypothetical protein
MSKQQPLDKIVRNAEQIPLSGSDIETYHRRKSTNPKIQ